MKILHTADNHIGFEAFSHIDKRSGINLRGLDYLESFKNICKIAISEKVDLFIIAGDMFDNPQPNQYYIIESMRMLKKISKTGITTLIINGNTDLARETPLAYLGEIDNVYVVTKPTTLILGSYDIVCVPYSVGDFSTMLEKALESSPSENKILVSHLSLKSAIHSSESREEITSIDASIIPDKFIYAALGHVHKFQQVNYSIPLFYSGSSERLDFSEEGEDKYTLLIEVDGVVSVKPFRLPIRKMHTFELDCCGLKVNDITKKIDELIEENQSSINNAIIKVTLYNVEINEKKNIDITSIKNKFSSAFEFIIETHSKRETTKVESLPNIEEDINNRLKSLTQDDYERLKAIKEDIWRCSR